MNKPENFTLSRVAFKIGEMVALGKIEEFEMNDDMEFLAVKIANDFESEIDVLNEELHDPMMYAERKLSKIIKNNS